MYGEKNLPPFNTKAALFISRLLPVKTCNNTDPLTCNNCSFVNRTHYNFCTNCGYPVFPNGDRLAIYNIRLGRRKTMQKDCLLKINQARNVLYMLAGIFMLGIFYVFSDWKETSMRGLIMIVLGFIFFGLGRWSHQKPFTSLLISLIIMLTFTAINTWAEFFSAGNFSSGAFMMLFVQVVLTYFLLKGVQGAFHADILEEEFKL